jgi:hypothetical protein
MYRIITLLIAIVTLFVQSEYLFAESCDIKTELPTHTQYIDSIEQCISARAK